MSLNTYFLMFIFGVMQRTGARILLAQKAFSAFYEYPLIGRYLSGTTASGLFEARLAHEEMGKENHVFCPAFLPQEMDELVEICDHIVFNSVSQYLLHRDKIEKADKKISVGLRINPECSTQEGHEIYDPCAPGSRLGITREALDKAIKIGLDLSRLEGFHFHTLCEQDSDALETTLAAVEEKFADLRKMGIKTIMITGDNPITAAAIAAEAGVDDFLAEATPEGKLAMIRDFQAKGHLVAMTGDGTNDAPALAQADVAVAMNSGTQAAKEAGNMVDLDSSPTKLIDIVRIGNQLLMTRGSLTTFSIANDVAKYFAIIPALFMGLYPRLSALNIMGLHSPQSAVLSAIIYNALIIIVLIPLALKGVKYREVAAGKLLSRNLLVYGLGGLAAPFIFVKLIDVLLVFTGLV